MFYKIAPKCRVWMSDEEQDILHAIEHSPDEQLMRSAFKQEQYHVLNRMVSKSVLWRKKLNDSEVLYGRKNPYKH